MSEEQERGSRQSGGGRSSGSRRRSSRPRRGYRRRPKTCAFCADKNLAIDYKQPDVLWRYLSDRGKIRPRRQTGACAKHQRRLATAIKRARHLALLPFVVQHPRTG